MYYEVRSIETRKSNSVTGFEKLGKIVETYRFHCVTVIS